MDLKQALALATACRGGVLARAAFRAFLGQAAAAFRSVALSGAACIAVVLPEPLVDPAVPAGPRRRARMGRPWPRGGFAPDPFRSGADCDKGPGRDPRTLSPCAT